MNGRIVAFIDVAGVSHLALVAAVNGLHPDRLTLVYIDPKGPDTDNIKKMFDVVHASDSSKDENNPAKPRYVFNAWRELDESHLSLPRDHPNFDHPFKRQDVAQNGVPIPIDRPVTDALDAAHLETLDPDDATELAALSGSGGMVAPPQCTPGCEFEPGHTLEHPCGKDLGNTETAPSDAEKALAATNFELAQKVEAQDATIAQLTEQLNQRPTDPPVDELTEVRRMASAGEPLIQVPPPVDAITPENVNGEIDVTLHGKTEPAEQFVTETIAPEGEDSAADAPAPEPPPAA
jgi:hypothetical protein